ncbi:MAG: tRNA (adenosine(37)-N6)-threonylcarbamoyltransferase complex dimerization subunit type 1 TsaB [Pirellulales bacterium]|nr:tRNA (adenosine(37)-N6)-threonylcarbamoyltransferase complex dimerization subunit type 1 TsaB [Pirellulales bacterium]
MSGDLRILALETTGTAGSVAALSGKKLLHEAALDPRQRSAQSLAPAIQQLLAEVGWRSADVQLTAVAIGPGSFTGLRVGVMTAKTWAYATGGAVLGVNTLEAIAEQSLTEPGCVTVVFDAQRKQLFSSCYERRPDAILQELSPVTIINVDDWLQLLAPGMRVSGPMLERIGQQLPAHSAPADPRTWHPRASTVGQLAARDWMAGRRDDLWALAPNYYRRSAAEEKADESCGGA